MAGLILLGGWAWLLLPSGLGGPLSLVWVRGESMEPAYLGGDLAVVYRLSGYEVGDVVAFTIPEGGMVIHRLVDERHDGFVPQGDNRSSVDPWVLDEDDIVGRAVLRIPAGGRMLHVLRQPIVLGGLAFLAVLAHAWRRDDAGTEEPDVGSGDPDRTPTLSRRTAPR